MIMTNDERSLLITQLNNSYIRAPGWVQAAVKHSMWLPATNPKTGKAFMSFKEAIENANDETLLTLKDDFVGNGDFIP